MKNILKISLIISAMLFLTACTGAISKHKYTKSDATIIYKVVKKGVITFMTPEQIEKARLDKLNIIVKGAYKVVEGNDANSQ